MNQLVTARSGIGCQIDANRLIERFWIGSAPSADKDLGACGFDTVVLCAEEYQPRKAFGSASTVHAGFDDAKIDPRTVYVATRAAEEVARRWRRGERVLVTCMAGRNRSGLVSALALKRLGGMSGHKALRHVQAMRPNALSNPDFAQFLSTLGARV